MVRTEPATVVMVPTYNEGQNIGELIGKVAGLGLSDTVLLVIDDGSPDGTADAAREAAVRHPSLRVEVMVKDSFRGRGPATVSGFRWCVERHADRMVEMDADLSHDPAYIPALLEAAKGHDVVLGSRFVEGGSDIDRGPFRRLVTRFANWYIRAILGIGIRDCTSGFKCYNARAIRYLSGIRLRAKGLDITQEILFHAVRGGMDICEVPIRFADRKKGRSSLRMSTMVRSLLLIPMLRLRYRIP